MGSSVIAEKQEIAHVGSDGYCEAKGTDICNPPSGSPNPYDNYVESRDIVDGTTSVFTDGHSAAIKTSRVCKSTMDEPGSNGGIISGVHLDEATWLTWQPTVWFDGQPVCTNTNLMSMNKGNTVSTGGWKQDENMTAKERIADDLQHDGSMMGAGCQPIGMDPGQSGESLTSDRIQEIKSKARVSESKCCAAKRAAGAVSNNPIVYTNGMGTSRQANCNTAQKIADLTCRPVLSVFDATGQVGVNDMAPFGSSAFAGIADFFQVTAQKGLNLLNASDWTTYFSDLSAAASTLSEWIVWNQIYENGPLELWAHSQGGASLSTALRMSQHRLSRTGKPPADMSDLIIRTFAGASWTWIDGPSYNHHIHVGDAVAIETGAGIPGDRKNLDAPGMRRLRPGPESYPGANANVDVFGGSAADGYTTLGADGTADLHDYADLIDNHSIDGNYLERLNELQGGCLGQP